MMKQAKKINMIEDSRCSRKSILEEIRRAVISVEGVAGLSGGIIGGISRASGMNREYRGIKIGHEGAGIFVDIQVDVYYGINIPELSFEIQQSVIEMVANKEDVKVDAVNVRVESVIDRRSDEAEEIKYES